MIPENRLSTTPQVSEFADARALASTNLVNYETGGVNISDSSQGLMVQTWRGQLIGNDITLDVPSNPLITPYIVYSGTSITEFSFTFDQLMRPVVAFVQNKSSKLYWYDSSVASYVTVDFGASFSNPRVTLDDKRLTSTTDSDVILAYIENNALYYRQQRDRFLTPRLLYVGVTSLITIGFGKNNRLLFKVTPT